MSRPWKFFLATVIGGALVTVPTISASARVAPTAQDRSFAAASAQTNLAEITIGKIALRRSQSNAVTALAHKTMSDHRSAQTKLTAAAKSAGITLPTAPNATQQAQATQLKQVASGSFDATYLRIQVAGHQLAVAATKKEIGSGSGNAIVSYAKQTLPVITGHLQMAQHDLNALGGPGRVPAGNGGQAATSSSRGWSVPLLIGGLVVLLACLGFVIYGRGRTARPAANRP